MAQHLERHPKMRATINLVPSLIKQIEEYLAGDVFDPVIDLMTKPAATLTREEQRSMPQNFFLASRIVMARSARYEELYAKAQSTAEFSEQEYRDLAVHYSLAWTGEYARHEEPFKSLVSKDREFSEEEREHLMEAQIANVRKILPLHKKLARNGQIELSTTPFYHPILPLLIDTDAAKEAMPYALLPKKPFTEPDEASTQLQDARAYFQSRLGITPNGVWPSEGSISNDALRLIGQSDFGWAASDEAVLARTIHNETVKVGRTQIAPEDAKYFPYRYETVQNGVIVFFRDHSLSDDIGFNYQSMDADGAVSDFEAKILDIRSRLIDAYGEDILDTACVSVILDGENCWEYYSNNGYDFLDRLYSMLSEHGLIVPTTFSDVVDNSADLPTLDAVVAGSWINANFRIWIGHPEDNRAWELLRMTYKTFEREKRNLSKLHGARLKRAERAIAAAHEHLMIAEGSDWCWWYGDDHFSAQKNIFDDIYRTHLRAVFALLDLTPPSELFAPIPSQVQSLVASNGHDWLDVHSPAMSRSDV